jgi:hypothetical protein
MKVHIPILVYTEKSEQSELLGIPMEQTYDVITGVFNKDYIIAYYPTLEGEKTIFHVMGDIFTSTLSFNDFDELVEEIEEE